MFVAQPGLTLGNRYSLTHVIGRGGMGEVWKAHDRELDSVCAVKFILQHLASDRGIRERFAREAKAVARLRSPHVVHILGVGEIENVPYLAMELLDGETLLSRLERVGRMHPAVTLKMLEQVAEALESAHHAGIVHRDLKPDNIWFWSGNKVFVKVLDFGVAKSGMTTESLQTATGALVGTPQYMSPEQALGNRDIDHRSDLWSMAVIAMECLSGKRPFESAGLGDLLMKIVAGSPPPSRDLAADLPVSLQDWWARALARDPRDRFQSATELVEALRPHLAAFETDTMHGAESARSARIVASERALPPSTGTVSVPYSLRAEPVPVESRHSRPVSVAAPSARLELVDSLAAESAPPRAPGSMGPISSSSRAPLQRREDGRPRSLLIGGAVLAVAVLLTLGRLFLGGAPEQLPEQLPEQGVASAARAPVSPEPSSPAAPPTAPAKPAPASAESPSASPVAPLDERSPWEPVLGGHKAADPSTITHALQPAVAPVREQPQPPQPLPVNPPASEKPPAPSTAGPPKPPKLAEPAVKPSIEATRPTSAPRDIPGESDVARKERLRKATGL
ncbi:MAG: protein kinase [Deltaproteobacteria bacterium]